MCGIAGILKYQATNTALNQRVKGMTDVLAHRGPDDEGFYADDTIGMGFRRLSIIDLNTGHQPLSNEDGSIWITFNGEIYNFQELKKLLLQKGHLFKTKSDTEVIVHLYEQFGTDCLQYLRGMFAFCIWDSNSRLFFAARDRVGIKPFFYCFSKNEFLWSSEIKSLMAGVKTSWSLNLQALDHYFTYGYTPNESSIYNEIKKLKAGHFIVIRLNGTSTPDFRCERYWEVTYNPVDKPLKDWYDEIVDELTQSVKMRLISDVPIGAFLSGGIDSSSVVALMSQVSNSTIKTFSIGFKAAEFSELNFARIIAEKYQTEHYERIVEPSRPNILKELINTYDEPFADASAIPTLILSEYTREYVTVALSGDGGDEVFAGYNDYLKIQNLCAYNFLPDWLNQYFWLGVHLMMPENIYGKKLTYQLSRPKELLKAYISIFNEFDRKKLFRSDVHQGIAGTSEKIQVDFLNTHSSSDIITNAQLLDINTYLVDDILTKVDRASMAHSLEVRVPILDHVFIEKAFQIPSNLKLHKGQLKYIFREAMQKHLTRQILDHKKHGFGVPLKKWLNSDIEEIVHMHLDDLSNPIFDYLNFNYVQRIIEAQKSKMRDMGRQVWSLIIFSEWLITMKDKLS